MAAVPWRGAWRAGVGIGLAFGLATCAPRAPVPPEYPHPERLAWAEAIDWDAARAEVIALAQAYVAVDTSNPPGNEAVGAALLESVLTAEGIEVARYPFAPGRDNLVAWVRAASPVEPPLCLMHHIDVVPADPARWAVDPFAGQVDAEGYLWGRGALDMKSTGVLEVLTLAWLKRLRVPLRRSVVLLAVGDEEVDNLGVRNLVEEHWADIGCSHALNEGGMGVQGALFDDLTTFAVSYAEKGSFWVRLHAHGEPGHGSTPLDDSAPVRLMAALDRLEGRKARAEASPELFTLLHAVGERVGGIEGAVLRSPGLTKALAMGKLMDHPLSRAMITDTLNVTGFGGGEAPNVVPGSVWANLDMRMLPGHSASDMLAELQALTEGIDGLEWEVLQDLPAEVSPVDDPVFEAVTRTLRVMFPDAAVGPLVMPGTTDSQVLRAHGVRSYGIAPFLLSQDALRTMHGDDERIHVDNLARGLEVMLRTVLDIAAADGRVAAR